MKYTIFFSLVLLSSSLVFCGASSDQEVAQPAYTPALVQDQDQILASAFDLDELQEQSERDIQLTRDDVTQELIKTMKDLWDVAQYQPDASMKELLDETKEKFSSLDMARALELSLNLLEEQGDAIPEKQQTEFMRTLNKLIPVSDDLDYDDMRCSCRYSCSNDSDEDCCVSQDI